MIGVKRHTEALHVSFMAMGVALAEGEAITVQAGDREATVTQYVGDGLSIIYTDPTARAILGDPIEVAKFPYAVDVRADGKKVLGVDLAEGAAGAGGLSRPGLAHVRSYKPGVWIDRIGALSAAVSSDPEYGEIIEPRIGPPTRH
jgi:hypothetical protein